MTLDPEERIERLITTVYRKLQQIQKKEGNIPFKKRCQQVIESIENMNSRAEPTNAKGRDEQDHYNNIGDLSSIRNNSKVVNVSNISMQQGDLGYDETKENLNDDQLFSSERPDGALDTEGLKNEFSFEKLKPVEKEQFDKVIVMFKDIKPQDELVIEKLEGVNGVIDKMNMEVVQAGQRRIVKMLKNTLLTNSGNSSNILRLFECANNLLVKMNKICLEIYTETLKLELKVILLFLANILGGKVIEKCLDSVYMTCSIDKFLTVTLTLFEKLDAKYSRFIPVDKLANAVRVYLNWLVIKVEKLQNVMVEEAAIKDLERRYSQFRFENLPQIHLGLANVLAKKVRNIEEVSMSNISIRESETPRPSEPRTDFLERPTSKELTMEELGSTEQRQMVQRMRRVTHIHFYKT